MRKAMGLALVAMLLLAGCSSGAASNRSAKSALQALKDLEESPVSQRADKAAAVASLVQQAGTPLFDITGDGSDELIFVYQGQAADHVAVNGGVHTDLKNIEGTNLFMGTVQVPDLAKAVVSYDLVVNDKNRLDPWSHGTLVAPNSVMMAVYGPKEKLPAELNPESGAPKGQIAKQQFTSLQLGGSRDIWVYTPPGYSKANSYPILLVADGQLYFDGTIDLNVVLDNLIAEKKIPPILAVGVASDPKVRLDEYVYLRPRFDNYQQFMDAELLPWMHKQYNADLGTGKTASLGLSNGGAWALYNALLHPNRSRGAILESALTTEGKLPQMAPGQRFYVAAGTLDPEAIRTQKQLVDIMAASHEKVKSDTGVGGHDGALSELQLVEGLKWVWGS